MTIALAATLALAGCSGVVPTGNSGASPTPTPSPAGAATTTATATQSPADSPTPTGSPSPTASPTPTPSPTATATAAYDEPQPPNTPLEGKNHDDGQVRMRNVEFVNVERTDDGAYTDFDLRIDADTRMPDVDPASHGDVKGEPYFLVYVEDELVARSDYVAHRNGTFVVDVHPGGLAQFEDGSLDLEVLLMDRDSEYDDVYGVWRTSFEYEHGE
jgi:hypothetical protein